MTTVISKVTINRLVKDIKQIKDNPLHDNGIYYCHDDDNILKGYTLIIGPKNTPYNYGYYLFSIDFPENYPFSPPKFTYCTNDDRTRFHPNLYINGKVCVSILNTWKGEQWSSCQTLSTVLLTICSLLDDMPLINEPGISRKHRDNENYNKIITYKNIESSIIGILNKKIYMDWFEKFDNIIVENFKENYKDIIDIIKKNIESIENDGQEYLSTSIYNLYTNIDYNKLKKDITKLYMIKLLNK
jgi:ubiquitin-conjugating enzyme E2 Z